ncbi:hypothetical protein EJB05_48590, partial [Eragrostis curvula]
MHLTLHSASLSSLSPLISTISFSSIFATTLGSKSANTFLNRDAPALVVELNSNSSSPPSTSWSLTLSSSLLLSRDTSTSPQGLNVPPYSSGTFGSQLELELLSEESLEFCERERDDNVRLELLLWMPRGYILCMYLLPAAWLMASCSFLSRFFMWLGLFSNAWCCLLCAVVSIVPGGGWFWRQTVRGCLSLRWFEINACELSLRDGTEDLKS